MSIKIFREECKKGGFDPSGLSDAELLLKPEAFKAIGKVKGWENNKIFDIHPSGQFVKGIWYVGGSHPLDVQGNTRLQLRTDTWHYYMHRFIDHLADDNTIDEALSKTLNL